MRLLIKEDIIFEMKKNANTISLEPEGIYQIKATKYFCILLLLIFIKWGAVQECRILSEISGRKLVKKYLQLCKYVVT